MPWNCIIKTLLQSFLTKKSVGEERGREVYGGCSVGWS
jgi:hypothetical protein